jgi:hypothetical protein
MMVYPAKRGSQVVAGERDMVRCAVPVREMQSLVEIPIFVLLFQ